MSELDVDVDDRRAADDRIPVSSAAGLALYQTALDELAGKHCLRSLAKRAGLDFSSNDYLGLACSPRLRAALATALSEGTPVGAAGSRLLRGNVSEHEVLEAAAAKFFHSERALYFGGGYVANYAMLSTLPQKEDVVVLDTLSHARETLHRLG